MKINQIKKALSFLLCQSIERENLPVCEQSKKEYMKMDCVYTYLKSEVADIELG